MIDDPLVDEESKAFSIGVVTIHFFPPETATPTALPASNNTLSTLECTSTFRFSGMSDKNAEAAVTRRPPLTVPGGTPNPMQSSPLTSGFRGSFLHVSDRFLGGIYMSFIFDINLCSRIFGIIFYTRRMIGSPLASPLQLDPISL